MRHRMLSKSVRFKKGPRTFRVMTGLSIEKYNELYNELVPLYEKSESKRLLINAVIINRYIRYKFRIFVYGKTRF